MTIKKVRFGGLLIFKTVSNIVAIYQKMAIVPTVFKMRRVI